MWITSAGQTSSQMPQLVHFSSSIFSIILYSKHQERHVFWRSLLAFAMIILSAGVASAQDKLTLALGQRGNWDTAIAPLGEQSGIFKKHGLVLDILWTQGAGES